MKMLKLWPLQLSHAVKISSFTILTRRHCSALWSLCVLWDVFQLSLWPPLCLVCSALSSCCLTSCLLPSSSLISAVNQFFCSSANQLPVCPHMSHPFRHQELWSFNAVFSCFSSTHPHDYQRPVVCWYVAELHSRILIHIKLFTPCLSVVIVVKGPRCLNVTHYIIDYIYYFWCVKFLLKKKQQQQSKNKIVCVYVYICSPAIIYSVNYNDSTMKKKIYVSRDLRVN